MGKVSEKQTLKQQLPYPYNQDLSQVLRRLDRRTPASRSRLANDPVTAAYLAAAMRMIERHLGPGAERTPIDPEDENSVARPLFGFLSQRAVAAEVACNPDPFPQVGSVSTLRSTWSSQSDFIADLLRFGLWSQYQPTHCDVTEVLDIVEDLNHGPDFQHAVQRFGYATLMDLITSNKFRLELIAMAAAEGDETIQKALVENYYGLVEPWKQVCTEVLHARKLKLRQGITLDHLVGMLTALAEGVALRAMIDPSVGVVDHRNQQSLLGTAMLAVIVGCTEPTGQIGGTSLDQAVQNLLQKDLTEAL
jgi:hypothetical protein